ncbi:MAG TPA: DUF885 domain-containing protein [Thermodesulfobacteriota bacterium]|nr:DUF885 domain-containing protein [Thermodesulfobacteriota bacterium]
MPAAEAMAALAEAILEDRWRTSPVTATLDGIHAYDRQLDEMSAEALAEAAGRQRGFLRRLAELDPRELPLDARLDHAVLSGQLEAQVADYEEVRAWEKDPALYANVALYGVYPLALRTFAPVEVRAEAAAHRLGQVRRLLAQAKANLSAAPRDRVSPRIFTETAIEVVQGGQAFFAEAVPRLAEPLASQGLKADLLRANADAMAAFADYLEWLRAVHLPRSTGRFAIGREAFDRKLRTEHGLPYDADQLAAIGEEAVEQAERALEALARTIDPDRSWVEQIEALKQIHPSPERLLDAYRAETERARAFVVEHRLATLPPGESLEVVETPLFERPLIAYAAMMAPAPFDEEQKSLFYVTPVDPMLPDAERRERLKGHATASIPITALHEAYPGHHLQLTRANRIPSRVRRVYSTPVFVEGWALYCEEMMYEAGFYPDPRVRLFQLKDLLWRACRVVVDVGLHCDGMTPEAAIELLVERAHLERPNAETEVRRYCATPTQPMSYLIGRREILALRDAWRAKAGKAFSLGEFHDTLLGYGSIPIALVREAMFARPSARKAHGQG